MMQTTMLPFPYSLSCPPFVDISSNSSVTSPSPSGTPSPPVSTYMSTFYDSMFATAPNSRHMLNNLPYPQHSTLSFKPSLLTAIPEKTLTKQNTCSLRRKSFTIEAILGLSQCQENAVDRSHKSPVTSKDQHSTGATRVTECRRHERMVSPNPYSVPSATPRSALTAVSTLFTDSTVKESKLKSSTANLIKDGVIPRDPIHVNSSPPPNGTTSISNSCSAAERQKSGGGLSSGKTKRIRTIFTPEQLERLETEFERQQYMVGPERLYLASALNLTEAQVKVWFQNRRIKWRKQHLEIQQARLAQLREEADTAESETEPDPPSHNEEVSTSHWGELLDDRK